MGLQKDLELEIHYQYIAASCNIDNLGLDYQITKKALIPDAYIRIDNLLGDKNSMQIVIGVYKNITDRLLIKQYKHVFKPLLESDKNIFVQAYNYIKTLPEFVSAVDC